LELLIVTIVLFLLLFILVTLFAHEKSVKTNRLPSGKMKEYWSGSERRRFKRVDTALHTKYSIDHAPRPKSDSKSKNISLGGILLELNEKIFPATKVILDIFLPNIEKPINARGEVVWVTEVPGADNLGRKNFNAGIKFLSMSPHDKDRLNKHVEDLS